MGLEDTFNRAVEDWIEHCSHSNILDDPTYKKVIDCEPYRQIVNMGKEALPFIRKIYDSDVRFIEKENGSGKYALFLPKPVISSDFMGSILDFQYGASLRSQEGFDKLITRGRNTERSLDTIKFFGLFLVVREIIGEDFSMPEGVLGRINLMEAYTKEWLDENMHRYVRQIENN